jgi:hypothetical protein
MRALAICAALLGLFALAGPAAAEGAAVRAFISGQAGTLPKAPTDQAGHYFAQPAVRRVIYALESGPIPTARAEALLAGGPATLDDLARVKLVRRQGGAVSLGFAYFTAADMARIHAVAQRYAPSLVAAYRAKAPQFAAVWMRYPVASVDRGQIAFDLIAGVGLNWDGLDILSEGGWRKPELVSGAGWRYSFFASEATPGYDYKGYYWGSSAFPADLPGIDPPMPLAFVSFGDPDSDPRMNFPDLLGLNGPDLKPAVRAAVARLGLRNDPLTGPDTLGVEAGRQVGRLLIALRAHAASEAELQAALPGDPVAAELQLLTAIAYVRARPDGRFDLAVPVFDTEDRSMFEAARSLNKAIIRRWIAANYGPIRGQLRDLTALRQGVSYEALFTQIWHELFGLATRELVAQHLVGDPYAPTNPSPGSLGMAWRPDLLQRVWR